LPVDFCKQTCDLFVRRGNHASDTNTRKAETMSNAIYLNPDMIPAHLRAGYSGKKFKAVVTTQVTIPSDAGLWSGGTRNTFQLVHLETGKAVQASDNMSSPWNANRKDQNISLQAGFAVVEHSLFCGKDMGLTFYVHPDNASALLPPPSAELSAFEQIVLNATCAYKSSYNGRDRYDMAKDDRRWGPQQDEPFPTRDQWQAAKAALIAKGLLNKAGAVTPAGRNVRVK
jgi:hypothetical protein